MLPACGNRGCKTGDPRRIGSSLRLGSWGVPLVQPGTTQETERSVPSPGRARTSFPAEAPACLERALTSAFLRDGTFLGQQESTLPPPPGYAALGVTHFFFLGNPGPPPPGLFWWLFPRPRAPGPCTRPGERCRGRRPFASALDRLRENFSKEFRRCRGMASKPTHKTEIMAAATFAGILKKMCLR